MGVGWLQGSLIPGRSPCLQWLGLHEGSFCKQNSEELMLQVRVTSLAFF